jgi:SAM-dependent methyltransferase
MRDWEGCYRNNDTPWDKGTSAPPLDDLVEEYGSAVFHGGPVLVPGCGLGHDVRRIAELGVPAHGVDISPTAVEKAVSSTSIVSATFEVGDFLDPAWRIGRQYAAIWEHTCFCAIDPALRADYVRAAADLLPPGGLLYGVFYLTPTANPSDRDGPPFEVTVEELDTLFAPWFDRILGKAPTRAYPGREGREWLAVYSLRGNPRL